MSGRGKDYPQSYDVMHKCLFKSIVEENSFHAVTNNCLLLIRMLLLYESHGLQFTDIDFSLSDETGTVHIFGRGQGRVDHFYVC